MKKVIIAASVLILSVGLVTGCTDTTVSTATNGEFEGKSVVASENVAEETTYGAPAKLGYMDPLLSQIVCQGVITIEQSRLMLPLIEAAESTEAGVEKSVADGIIDAETGKIVVLMLAQGKQPDPDVANKMEDDLLAAIGYSAVEGGFPIPGTNVTKFYGDDSEIPEPAKAEGRTPNEDYYGQDGHYFTPCSYTDNGDGTVTDNITGLTWQVDFGEKITWETAMNGLDEFNEQALGGYSDWRVPTIKELYSLVQFTGSMGHTEETCIPFFDTDYFTLSYGTAPGDRLIDSQMCTSTIYDSVAFESQTTMSGYNFADGRIKGYPAAKLFYCIHVRGNTHYGQNLFVDNGDGTISDLATGLIWMTYDAGYYGHGDIGDGTMNWKDALAYCERLQFAGHGDWRLPNAKELQSIVDYHRTPGTTDSPAIDSLFQCTEITNQAGMKDWGFYWSASPFSERASVYVGFGRGMGAMGNEPMDVHGVGCQRSDPRVGSRADYPSNGGPQGDAVRVYNMVRAVRYIK